MTGRYLIDVVQFGAGPSAVVGFLAEPLGANFDPAAAGLAASGPVGPLAELTVRRAGDDAGLLDIAYSQWRDKTHPTRRVSQGQSQPLPFIYTTSPRLSS